MLPTRNVFRLKLASAKLAEVSRCCLRSVLWLALLGVLLLGGVSFTNAAPGKVNLAWDNPTPEGVSDYAVYVGVRSGLYSRRILSNGKTNLTVNGLQDGVNYFFAVSAINWYGPESSLSPELQYALPCSGRIVRLVAKAAKPPSRGMTLSWPGTPGRKYEVFASHDLLNWESIWVSAIARGQSAMEFTDPSTASTGRRFYKVEATGPYIELPDALEVAPVSGEDEMARIGFSAVEGAGYEVQFSADGVAWQSVWSSVSSDSSGWTEILDWQTNAVAQRRYRLLLTSETAQSGQPSCADTATEAPQVDPIPAQETFQGIATLPIVVRLSDLDTPASLLELNAESSDPGLIPPGQIKITGTGAERKIVITPGQGAWGTAVVDVFVSDGINTTATAFEVNVLPDVPGSFPVAIRTQGGGTVIPNLDGQMLKVGKRYTVTAVPDPGYIFVGWLGDVQSSSPKLTFQMRPRLELEASFAVNPHAAIQGAYHGLVGEEGTLLVDRSGTIAVTATERGTYSGKLTLGGKTYSFTGQLDSERNGTNFLNRPATTPLRLELAFGGGNSDQVNGRVTDGEWQAPLRGYRASEGSRDLPGQFTGTYVLVIPGQPSPESGPAGSGIATVKVDAYGMATFAGTLADGTKVSWKSVVSQEGNLACSVSLYSKLGALHGWQRLVPGTSNSLSGSLRWTKPALAKSKYYPDGFAVNSVTTGSSYTRPASSERVLDIKRGELNFSGGDLPTALTQRIEITTKNKVLNLGTGKLSLSFNLSGGQFSGKVTDPMSGRMSSFQGAVLQDRNGGLGFLLGPDQSARVELRP